MNAPDTFDTLVAAANAELDDPARNRVMYPQPGVTPRFELYHAGLSMCSYKVRTVLAEKAVPYVSHELVIVAGKGLYADGFRPAENYRPGYVRLRLHAAAAAGWELARRHTMRTSVDTEGFDACVVPLLVDRATKTVVADSKRIMRHIDREVPEPALIPADPAGAAQVMRQVDIIDGMPHPAMLYGFHPDDDRRPDFIKAVMGDVYDGKVEQLRRLIDLHRDDAALVRAYEAKIAKELAGKAQQHDPAVQRAYRQEFADLVRGLEAQLATHDGEWVCGADFTLADVVWGVSLYRIHWLGYASLWAELPRVQAYTRRVYRRPSIRNDVIGWPSPMPPSPHAADID